ncbi:MAG TPA: hypothetical protein VE650_17550 [Acetobacteraceae bacterium]|nr:hypothetical protein [Acetobacteraceae bacterium]
MYDSPSDLQAIATPRDHLGVLAAPPRAPWLFASALPGLPVGRLLHLRMPGTLSLDQAYRAPLDALKARLGPLGVQVESLGLPFPVENFAHLQETLCYWEAARIPGPGAAP